MQLKTLLRFKGFMLCEFENLDCQLLSFFSNQITRCFHHDREQLSQIYFQSLKYKRDSKICKQNFGVRKKILQQICALTMKIMSTKAFVIIFQHSCNKILDLSFLRILTVVKFRRNYYFVILRRKYKLTQFISKNNWFCAQTKL